LIPSTAKNKQKSKQANKVKTLLVHSEPSLVKKVSDELFEKNI
jgi:hypothetical protein